MPAVYDGYDGGDGGGSGGDGVLAPPEGLPSTSALDV